MCSQLFDTQSARVAGENFEGGPKQIGHGNATLLLPTREAVSDVSLLDVGFLPELDRSDHKLSG